MIASHDDLTALVAAANLAPSVHNTQPTRWRLEPDGALLVLEETARRLPVGDPQGRDADVSHGAAIEGLALALGARGVRLSVEPLGGGVDRGLRPVARLRFDAGGGSADPLAPLADRRRTYRGAFARAEAPLARETRVIGETLVAEDVTLANTPQTVARLAALNDAASLKTFRDGPYRAELVSWMRLSRRHSRWAEDGLNAEAMEMSPLEAAGAAVVLRPGVFEALDGLGLARLFVAEAAVVRTASAVVLFHRPEGEPPLQTGRRFHRLWLQFTALGLAAAPMAVLADDVETRALIASEFAIPAGRRLITAFRIGPEPRRELGPKPRLPTASLLV